MLPAMRRQYLVCCFCLWCVLLAPLALKAGIIRGRITDPKGEVLAFANVAVKGTSTSTASNEQGNYQLPLAAGRYELVFQYVGFKPHVEAVRVAGGDTATTLNVTLTPENYQLREVVVRAKDKDPAYAIVQHAIDWRSYHRREVAAFTARTYIKALARLNEAPSRILGLFKTGPDLKPGIIYLSESVSEVAFRQPNLVRERMISSKVSGDAKAFSLNRAGAGRGLSFYNPVLKLFSERGFVSPIAPNAFLFYQYTLEGTTQQNGQMVHKIRVTPRRRTDPVFAGHIYVIEGTWRLHSVSLTLNKDAQLDYVDDVRIDQIFAPAPNAPHVWLLQTQKLTANYSAFGFKGNAYLTVVFSSYRVTPTYANRPVPTQAPAPAANEPAHAETVAEARQQRPNVRALTRQVKRQSKRTGAAAVDSLARQAGALEVERMGKHEVLRVEKGVNERDSAYWAQIRPVPLTDEEKRDYRVKDSTEVVRNSKPYQDSLDRIRNKFDAKSFMLTGYTYNQTHRKEQFYVAPLFNILQYSTVEGTIINPQFTYTRYTDDRRRFWLTPSLRYGTEARLFSPSLELNWQHDAARTARLQVVVGRTVENFDPNSQLTPAINTSYTLLRNRNFAKYYQRRGAEVGYLREVLNGLTARGAVSYFDRRELQNATIDLLNDIPGRAFTPNQPVAAELPQGAGFGRSRALGSEVWLSYQPGQRYISRPDGRVNLGSRYPTFRFTWRQGWGVENFSDVRYTMLEVGVRQSLNLGLLGTSNYYVNAGGFLGKPELAFMDYRHFSGNLTRFAADFSRFQLLDYYRYSTRRTFVEAHYDHHFNGFFLNKVPVLKRLKWQEVGTVNYLHTPTVGHYVELGVGIEHVFKFLRVDYFTALQSGRKLEQSVRVGFGF
ncbi:carboxypeptidase-like regulatory domain-containing protein [Hymenobacter oligotrophus]|uniref:Carboxypeptidase-like regulatory domain-containing protein n=1 Tax=Hymenobacter oligotrophus TaxID=2319843 RepID=A0A3B7RV63_9BACT|nr:carboxypeptidase-like regulatory domain-containing protein [Hymenobacter oligotrophus]